MVAPPVTSMNSRRELFRILTYIIIIIIIIIIRQRLFAELLHFSSKELYGCIYIKNKTTRNPVN